MRLTSTLQVYLEENSSRARAAKRMGVHEKTISCRVKQAQEILERDLDGDTLGRGP
ncbi:MAG TPA: helix-turn-helix domain-containing protein [Solirubrobacteraceae bacterium]|nr:helix-turn-helix domain-containing protein [Solirubrobacteraceae bacterium]